MPEQTSNQNGKYTQDQKCIKDVLLEVRLTSHESAYTLNEVCLQNDQLNGDHCNNNTNQNIKAKHTKAAGQYIDIWHYFPKNF